VRIYYLILYVECQGKNAMCGKGVKSKRISMASLRDRIFRQRKARIIPSARASVPSGPPKANADLPLPLFVEAKETFRQDVITRRFCFPIQSHREVKS
jgi:hypothetical protein